MNLPLNVVSFNDFTAKGDWLSNCTVTLTGNQYDETSSNQYCTNGIRVNVNKMNLGGNPVYKFTIKSNS